MSTDTFTGRIQRVKVAPETDYISTPMMCVDNRFHVMPGKTENMSERLALLDEMLDAGMMRVPWDTLREASTDSRYSTGERGYLYARVIVNDWKARVSVMCPEDE
jgi:hypothetical protein